MYTVCTKVIVHLLFTVLSMCQVHGHKAVLYCCFTDTIYLSSAMMKTYLPLLTTRPLKEIVQVWCIHKINLSCGVQKLIQKESKGEISTQKL